MSCKPGVSALGSVPSIRDTSNLLLRPGERGHLPEFHTEHSTLHRVLFPSEREREGITLPSVLMGLCGPSSSVVGVVDTVSCRPVSFFGKKEEREERRKKGKEEIGKEREKREGGGREKLVGAASHRPLLIGDRFHFSCCAQSQ